MKKLLLLGMILCVAPAFAKEVSVMAVGFGDDYDWAVLNAVENAVRQSSEVVVENTTGIQKTDVQASVSRRKETESDTDFNASMRLDSKGDFDLNANGYYGHTASQRTDETDKITSEVKDNSKKIPAKYKGSVSSYTVVEHTQENGQHKVTINAIVIKPDVYDAHDYQSKNITKKAGYSLAVVPFKARKKLMCLGQNVSLGEINEMIDNLYTEHLSASRRFNVVDRKNFDAYAGELALITQDMTLPENQVKLKNIVSADYILVGNIDNFYATTNKKHIEMTGETLVNSSCGLTISYRLLETATMEVVFADSVSKTLNKNGYFSSCYNVEKYLFEKAIEEASEEMLSSIFPDYRSIKKEISAKKVSSQKTQEEEPAVFKLPFD